MSNNNRCSSLWIKGWRDRIFLKIDQSWDIIIIGGGITGAGILREASRSGLNALLVEQRDFAWGTSSRSSKLIHGGLRYLKDGNITLTRASVMERERLLEDGPGLINPLGFLLTIYEGDETGRWTYEAGLSIYDLLALHWGHQYYSANDFQMLAPRIAHQDLVGGFRYGDAQTDDARLVLRVIAEAVLEGGTAINYVKVIELIKDNGSVIGVRLRDYESSVEYIAYARVVINATGAWVDELRRQVHGIPKIRRLRGSHLFFPSWRLPVAQAVSFLHPIDRRPVFIFPWEGVTIVGTTDKDHEESLELDPLISPEEVTYLMVAVESQFPSLDISLDDVISTCAGVRPVIDTGKEDPSQESRDHVIWIEEGLVTITGGKLTTFRLIALDVFKAIKKFFPELPDLKTRGPILNPVDYDIEVLKFLGDEIRKRIVGRFGYWAKNVVDIAEPGELVQIPGTLTTWAELRWAARSEGVVHLEDLLLRRVRLGLLLPGGGEKIMPAIRAICQPELGWDDDRWDIEEEAYLDLWRSRYYLPDQNSILDWKKLLKEVELNRKFIQSSIKYRASRPSFVAGGLLMFAAVLLFVFWRHRRS